MKKLLFIVLVLMASVTYGGQLIHSNTGYPELTTLDDPRLNRGDLFVTFASLVRGENGFVEILEPSCGQVALVITSGWGYFPASVVAHVEGLDLSYRQVLLVPAGWRIVVYLTQHGCDQINARRRLLEEDRLIGN